MATDSRFPATRASIVAAVASPDARTRAVAWDELVLAYWKPVYKYLRLRWRADPETAADRTQDFFAHALEKGDLAAFDQERARFRTFLRVCVDHFAANALRASRAEKRGGGRVAAPLDFGSAESELVGCEPVAPDDHDAWFHREWMRSLFQGAIADLRRLCTEEGRTDCFAAFARYDLEDHVAGARPSYADLARELGVTETRITTWLHWARQHLREALLARLAKITANEHEFRAEARQLLGVDPP